MMAWSETITFQLLPQDYFKTFTPKAVADAKTVTEVLFALTRDSREEVDAIVDAGGNAGGRVDMRQPIDMGFLYNRCVEDPDGHVLEFVWMDMSAPTGGAGLQCQNNKKKKIKKHLPPQFSPQVPLTVHFSPPVLSKAGPTGF